MKRSMLIPFIAIIISIISQSAYANLELAFSVHSETAQGPEMKDKVMHDSTMKVVLGEDFASYTESQRQVIYDFRKRRIYTLSLDPKVNVYADDSLFSIIGFRAAEFERREELAGALESSKIKKQLITTAFIEHLFSIPAAHGHARVTEVNGNGSVLYRAEGMDLLAWSTKGLTVEEGELRQFVRFFRYYLGGHPAIIRQLKVFGKIPNTLKFYIYDIGREEVRSLALLSSDRTPDTPYSLGALQPGVLPTDHNEAMRAIQASSRETPSSCRKRNDALLSSAESAFSSGDYLDSMLGYLEYTLQTGKPFPGSYQRNRGKLLRDKNVTLLMSSRDPKNPDEAQKAILALQQLRAATLTHKHVLLLLEAKVQARYGNSEEARQLFVSTLDRNPFNAGAYMAFGDFSYRSFNMRQAWQCWEQCGKLAPEYLELQEVDELEERLASEYSEFF